MARDKTITITSFSAGQTNTRAKKGFRMSSLLNVELDNFGDSLSSISGLVEDFDDSTDTAIIGKVIKKDDFVILYRTGKIILIKKDLKPVAIGYQSSLSFELSDACQIKENKYILVVNYQSHTEYLKLDLSDNSYSTFEPKIYPPFQYSPMASIDSLDFVKKSYCADYGTVKKDYNSVKTGIDTVDRFLIDGGSDTYFTKADCILCTPVLIEKSQNYYYVGFIKIEFNSTVSITGTSIVLGTTIINIIGSFIEIDGLRAIISSISSESTNDTVVIEYIMVDVAEDDVNNVVLNNIKFDMFKWFHPTKVDYVRDRLTFYGFKENKNMYFTSIAGSSNNFTFPRDKISPSDAIKVTIGAENFGRLVKITDNQNICFIGTKGIKSISSEKFTPLKVFDMASIYKGYIDSFVPTTTGIIAIVSDSEDFYKSTIVHISYLTDFNKSEISRLSLDSEIMKNVSDLKKIGEYSGLERYICKRNNRDWVQFYLSVKDKIVFSSKIELPAGSPLSKNSTINNIILYNARGILFVDDSNHTRFFQYHKIPISGRFLKVTSERDIPVFSNDDIGIITDEDDIIVYQGNNSSFDLNNGRQKIKRGQTFLTGKAINSEIIIDDIEVIVDNKGDSIFGEVTNIKRVTMKFLNKSSGVTVNGDRSAEKGLGYYNDYNAVVYTPNSELNTRAMVRITNKDFGYFNIRMIIIFAEVGGNL
jgi:hypothetical protein